MLWKWATKGCLHRRCEEFFYGKSLWIIELPSRFLPGVMMSLFKIHAGLVAIFLIMVHQMKHGLMINIRYLGCT